MIDMSVMEAYANNDSVLLDKVKRMIGEFELSPTGDAHSIVTK